MSWINQWLQLQEKREKELEDRKKKWEKNRESLFIIKKGNYF